LEIRIERRKSMTKVSWQMAAANDGKIGKTWKEFEQHSMDMCEVWMASGWTFGERDDVRTATLEKWLELWAGRKEDKQLVEKFWQMLGVEKDETVRQMDWMTNWATAMEVIKYGSGWWMYEQEETVTVFKDGRQIGEMIVGRGSWDIVVRGKKYWEKDGGWVEPWL
jgi:hypothetical protein